MPLRHLMFAFCDAPIRLPIPLATVDFFAFVFVVLILVVPFVALAFKALSFGCPFPGMDSVVKPVSIRFLVGMYISI